MEIQGYKSYVEYLKLCSNTTQGKKCTPSVIIIIVIVVVVVVIVVVIVIIVNIAKFKHDEKKLFSQYRP